MLLTDQASLVTGANHGVGRAVALGRLDVLAGTAGGIGCPAIDVPEADFEAVWQLDVRSASFLSQHAVVYLAGPASSLVTGVTPPVDGGWTAR